MTEQSIGLALWGDPPFGAESKALEEMGFALHGRPQASEADLHAEHIAVVGIFLPQQQRAYWVQKGLSAGKSLLCQQPIGLSLAKTKALGEEAADFGLLAPVLYSGWAQKVLAASAALGPLLYIDLAVHLPQSQLAAGGTLVKGKCVDALALMGAIAGPVDSVYGRSRSLAANRPDEDWAQGLIRFKNGVEGSCRLVGLADLDQIEIGLYGAAGSQVFREVFSAVAADGVRAQFKALHQWLSRGIPMPFGWADFYGGVLLAAWINRAARLDQEVRYRDLNL